MAGDLSAPGEILKHCWTCRQETPHGLVFGIRSRTMYQCRQACGAVAREVTAPELSTPMARQLAQAKANAERERWGLDQQRAARKQTAGDFGPPLVLPSQPWPIARPAEEIDPAPKAPKKKEMSMSKNALQEAIAAEVKDAVGGLATKEDLDKLEAKVKDAATPAELDRRVDTLLEEKLPELIERALLQMLTRPKAGGAEGGRGGKKEFAQKRGRAPIPADFECPRKHRGPHGWQCLEAAGLA